VLHCPRRVCSPWSRSPRLATRASHRKAGFFSWSRAQRPRSAVLSTPRNGARRHRSPPRHPRQCGLAFNFRARHRPQRVQRLAQPTAPSLSAPRHLTVVRPSVPKDTSQSRKLDPARSNLIHVEQLCHELRRRHFVARSAPYRLCPMPCRHTAVLSRTTCANCCKTLLQFGLCDAVRQRGWPGGVAVHKHDTLSIVWLSRVSLRPDIPDTVISF